MGANEYWPQRGHHEAISDVRQVLRRVLQRYWPLWLLLSAVLALMLDRGAEWMIHRGEVRRAMETEVMALQPPPGQAQVAQAPASPAPDQALSVGATTDGYVVSKCISASGRAEYSDGPCPQRSWASTLWVQPDLNIVDGMSAAARDAARRSLAAIAGQQSAAERRPLSDGIRWSR